MSTTPKPPLRKRGQGSVRVLREGAREPRLPHDLDESADSQVKGAPETQQAIGRKAYDDIQAGRVDTDRGPVLERLGRQLASQAPPAPPKRRRSR